jgi:phosphate transport system substrate-binding protein
MKTSLKLACVAIASLAALSGCSRGSAPSSTQANHITIKGSDTMVHLASNWAEAYSNAHPGKEVSVTGGGSGTGIAALLNRTTDICIASRQISVEERQLAEDRQIVPNEITVARDGIAVVVNPDNPVSELTIEQIGKIYTGRCSNWMQVGGPDQPIVVLSRESSSGTYVFFQEHVMQKRDYVESAMLMPSTSAIIQSVSQDSWAIGYVGLGYAEDARQKVKVLKVMEKDNADAVEPSEETIDSGVYPIARSLYFYTNGQPKGLVKDVVDFVLSPAGQKIVRETGYVPVG